MGNCNSSQKQLTSETLVLLEQAVFSKNWEKATLIVCEFFLNFEKYSRNDQHMINSYVSIINAGKQ